MFKQYIDGKLVDGLGKPKNVLNPATGEVAGVVGCATAGQATQALEAAAKAFKTWSKTPVSERIAWILKLRDAVEAEKEPSWSWFPRKPAAPTPKPAGM